MHEIQKSILKELLFKTDARFAELNVDDISNDHFSFHIKRLTKLGLVKKQDDGSYTLTSQGKEYANRLDADSEEVKVEKQAKIGGLTVAVKEIEGETKYLVQKRLKQTFYGFHGFVTGKIKWGEKLKKGAARELKEETGLEADKLELRGVEHKLDYSKEGEVLEDKFFYVFKAVGLEGDLKEDFEGGENRWLTQEEIKGLDKKYEDVLKILSTVKTSELDFFETETEIDADKF